MNKNEELNDRLMDELLREDARGESGDLELLAAVQAEITGEVADHKVTPIRKSSHRAPYAWAAALTVSAASVLGYLGWRATNEGPEIGDVAAAPFQAIGYETESELHDPMVPRKRPLGRYSKLWANSAMSEAPADLEEVDLMRPAPPAPGSPGQLVAKGDKTRVRRTPEGEMAQLRDDEFASSQPAGPSPRVLPTDATPPPVGRKVVGDVMAMELPAEPVTGKQRADTLLGRHAPPVDRENYGQLVDQPWRTALKDRFSTFSVDVDTASYSNIRRMLQQGVSVPADAVRIEECINYFDYRYSPPTQGGPFAVHVDLATCPWAADHRLMKVGLKGMEVPSSERPASNLVFLIDVSGSMQGARKLPLLVESMKVLVEELDERDRVGIVVYAGAEGVVLNSTHLTDDGRGQVLAALNKLRSGGSTNGGAGIMRAYALAQECFVEGGTNRVILATDGDFNVGTTGQGDLVKLVKDRAQSGVFLSVLGFGTGNINDSMLEAITNNGNGNYYYIDSQKEGRKVFLNDLSGTLVTIAKDVKIQVDFNPGKVQAYRLIGYANRILRNEDFNNDKIDAGDIGAGHTVTALYEIVPVGAPSPVTDGVDGSKYDKPAPAPELVPSDEWLTVKLRYKRPDGNTSTKMEVPVAGDPVAWEAADGDFQFAAGVALFGMKLRQSNYTNDAGWDLVRTLAKEGSAHDIHGYRAEFRTLVERAAGARNE
jgi:Ca-activated chloride channel family protein